MADPDGRGQLAALATAVAREASDFLLTELRRARTSVGTKSTHTDMVTDVDHRSERLIVERITQERPDDGILGEEGSTRTGSTGVEWVIDPLDGTTNYLYGYPGFGVSIAAVGPDGPLVGAVADPFHGELFQAVAGGGSDRDGERLVRRDEPVDLATALVATGFSYEPGRRRAQAAVLTEVLPRVRDIRRGGAAAVDLCWAACFLRARAGPLGPGRGVPDRSRGRSRGR
jgi:myo-inositol-1(or 4)-monophosphatase